MTEKLTINEPTYNLELTKTEFELVFALLGHVRLSTNGNKYQQATYDLLVVAEQNDMLDFDCVDVEFKQGDGYDEHTFIEVSEMLF